MARTVTRAHWITSNETSRMPTAYLYVQTAQRPVLDAANVAWTFRLACTRYVRRSHHDRSWSPPVDGVHETPADLWRYVESLCRRRGRLVVVAHDLGVVLRSSQAFVMLPERGWTLRMARLDRGAALAVWWRDGASVMMVDALAWLPAPLDDLAGYVGLDRRRAPSNDDGRQAHVMRTMRDVEIVAESFGRLMEWVESADLGNWRPTASGQVFQAWRHRFMTDRVLAHDDVHAREAERRGAWTGRCEAWRHGALTGGPWVEWDARAAYCRIAAENPVPVALRGSVASMSWRQWSRATDTGRVLADCTVTTDVPVVPARGPHGIVWPVGTFTTTLWDCEVLLAIDAGADVTLGRAWTYRMAPALRDAARWVLELLDDQGPDSDPLVRLVAKGWSRSLVGRFAARWPRWEVWHDAPTVDTRAVRLTNLDTGERSTVLQLGRRQVVEGEPCDAPDSAPAITSWITAQARCDLWRLMGTAGRESVVYVDTDSVIVDRDGNDRLAAAQVPGLRVKGTYRDLTVLGPRQLVVNYRPRIAGVPRDAVLDDEGRWRSQAWQTVRGALRQGVAGMVTVVDRATTVDGIDHRRTHLPDGSTASIVLDQGSQR